jgi:cytochrome P450
MEPERRPDAPHFVFGWEHARAMRRDLIGFCTGLSRNYGDVASFQLGPVPSFQLTHPDHIHEVLVNKTRSFRKPDRLRQVFGRFQGSGLFVSEGERWVRQRRLLQWVFHPSRLRSYATSITDCAVDHIDRWGGYAEVDFQAEMMRLALVVFTRALFSSSIDDVAEPLAKAVSTIQRWSIRELNRVFCRPRWLPLWGEPDSRRAIGLLRDVAWRMIERRSPSMGGHDDVLDRLLAAGEAGCSHPPMNRRQIQDELITLLVAGYETTGVAMTWAGWLLARHRDIQQRLSDEIRGVLGNRIPDFVDLPQLRVVEMALKEAMRLFPPAYFFSREVTETVEVGGCIMRPSAQVFLSPYLTQRDPRWFPDPATFDPRRFAVEQEQHRPACAWFPFGAGPRACIGRGFALMEGTLVLSTVLQRYRLEPAPGQGEPELEAQISLHPKGGIRLSVKRRDG